MVSETINSMLKRDISVKDMLYVFTDYPIKNRYQSLWIKWWKRELDRNNIEYLFVLTKSPRNFRKTKYNVFTDSISASLHEIEQLYIFMKKYYNRLKKDDILFFFDLDFPGISIGFINFIKSIKRRARISGFFHGGSWLNNDWFASVAFAKRFLELSTFIISYKAFVATNYHKEKIINYFLSNINVKDLDINKILNNKIRVVFAPFYTDYLKPYKKYTKNKSKDLFIYIDTITKKDQLNKIHKIIYKLKISGLNMSTTNKFIHKRLNVEYCRPKNFKKCIAESKCILFIRNDETFSYSLMESLYLDTIPIAPAFFSFKELLDEELLYESIEHVYNKVLEILLNEPNYREKIEYLKNKYIEIGKRSIKMILTELGLINY